MLSLYEDFFSTSRRNAKNKLNISSRSGTIFHSQTRPGTHTIHKERFTVPTDAHTNSPTLHTRAGAHTRKVHCAQSGCFSATRENGSLHLNPPPNPHTGPLTLHTRAGAHTRKVHCARIRGLSAWFLSRKRKRFIAPRAVASQRPTETVHWTGTWIFWHRGGGTKQC